MLLKGRHPVRTVDIMLTCIAESVDRFNADIAKLLVSANEAAANTKPRLPVRGPRLLMPDHPRGSSIALASQHWGSACRLPTASAVGRLRKAELGRLNTRQVDARSVVNNDRPRASRGARRLLGSRQEPPGTLLGAARLPHSGRCGAHCRTAGAVRSTGTALAYQRR
jgi:hypothetical protein